MSLHLYTNEELQRELVRRAREREKFCRVRGCPNPSDDGCWLHECTHHCRMWHVSSEHSCCPRGPR